MEPGVLILGGIVALIAAAAVYGWVKSREEIGGLKVKDALWRTSKKKTQEDFNILSKGIPDDDEFIDSINDELSNSDSSV